jgi:hypothetical protein
MIGRDPGLIVGSCRMDENVHSAFGDGLWISV